MHGGGGLREPGGGCLGTVLTQFTPFESAMEVRPQEGFKLGSEDTSLVERLSSWQMHGQLV